MNRTLFFRNVTVLVLFGLFFIAGTAHSGQKLYKGFGGKQIYTAHNIWIWPSHNMNCLNYKGGRSKIPVGTKVERVWIENNKPHMHDDFPQDPQIVFVLAETGQRYHIRFTPFYHPGKTPKKYLKYMFTTQSLAKMADRFNTIEMQAIKAGAITEGMCKKAVIASYGPPSERHTRSRKNNTWIYFINKRARLKIHFLKNQATGRTEVAQMDIVGGSNSQYGLKHYPRLFKIKPVQAAQPAPIDLNDPEQKLKKLKSLYDKGLITEEEYQRKRQQIINSL